MQFLINFVQRVIVKLAREGVFNFLPDKPFLKLLFLARMGKKLDLRNPKTFNEKIQWLKINDRSPRYVDLVDKEKAKEIIKELLGEEYVVPLIGSWDSVEKIDFDALPDKCVLKCNHDQGSTLMFDREKGVDEDELRKYYRKRLLRSAFDSTREWPYKNISPRVICEPFLCEDIIDYKIFCFNGEPGMVNIGQKSIKDHIMHITFLDTQWDKMPFQRSDFEPVKEVPQKPENYEKMLEIARKLAQGTDFVRIDLFNVGDRIYFSEFSLYPTSGYIKFEPEFGDEILGEKIVLTKKN